MNPPAYRVIEPLTALNEHPLAACLVTLTAVGIAIAVMIGMYRLVRAAACRQYRGERAGTVLTAAIATGVSAQGMWIFMGDALHLTTALRIMFFGFLETMTITSAIRARAAQRTNGSAGVDGVAMWVLTGLSAILSATEADNLGTVLIRLSAPLVAAWGWERSMALERHLRTGQRGPVNWRLTPERLLVRLGLADPNPHRNASDEAAQRSLIAVALAVDDARVLRDGPNPSLRRMHKAQQRLRRAMRRAAADGGLIPVEGRDRREVLLEHIAILRSTSVLLDLDMPNPWPSIGNGQSAAESLIRLLRSDAQQDVPAVEHGTGLSSRIAPGPSVSPIAECDRVTGARSGAPRDLILNGQTKRLHVVLDDDLWATVAEQVCADDPARRRHPDEVEAILRLHHEEHRTYPQIAREVDGFSKHAVGRVIRQARKYHSTQHASAGRGGTP
ncbi:hypothetical protein IU500_24795 [Nocardia terpenica]|uniref:hypothetical protein n=1 Tax=Nocardia terpenica TaxID=455432 RepID=UPI0018962D64|nr:hypothetical protein [Nocardia terpenica]MBF6064721.1 hypothetical protein [Nocardia terpenica]MBF6107236.1 hypothetical protein [Nocardia terpenica]MBF6114993.1 hypothetical protein [Nocardia terpenica]MBF6122099.1 hypothetical protein [Nocardia terpenica]MBF6154482.1 hypothetical protein [Nocardia terpenica]